MMFSKSLPPRERELKPSRPRHAYGSWRSLPPRERELKRQLLAGLLDGLGRSPRGSVN